jgi:K+-transporting ATPase ATPase C chain
MIRRQLITGFLMTVAMIVLLGVVYPFVVTGVAQVAFQHQADGSLITGTNGRVVGSALIGQNFTDNAGNPDARYFQPRPSAAGAGYDGLKSGSSNLGPSNVSLLRSVADRVRAYRTFNRLPAGAPVPVDAVTASGSGLDPHISVRNAEFQVARVAAARGLSPSKVRAVVAAHTEDRPIGFLGETVVNVLELNLALDRLG